MNLENLKLTRDAIIKAHRFDMQNATWCIAGCANSLTTTYRKWWENHSENDSGKWSAMDWYDRAQRFLGITPEQASILFWKNRWPSKIAKMSDFEGALYLLDGLILSAELEGNGASIAETKSEITAKVA